VNAVPPDLWQRLLGDPVLFYSTAAAVLLAAVSLATGLARGDVLVLVRPRSALGVLLAVALAFVITAAAEWALGRGAAEWVAGTLRALARVPLYIVALAFGPGVGLVTGALFGAATAGGTFPGTREALFTFELVVLGWLGIYPSPRVARWAGPLDVALARCLTWGTAGIAWLAYNRGTVDVVDLIAASGRWPWGALVSAAALFVVSPRWYSALFPDSRVIPAPAPAVSGGSVPPSRELVEPGLDPRAYDGRRGRSGRALAALPLRDDDPNG